MKFTAAFDELKQGEYESGFNRMLTTATKDPVVLLGFMKADHTRLEFLESLLDNPKVERYADTLMQIISLYYNSVWYDYIKMQDITTNHKKYGSTFL